MQSIALRPRTATEIVDTTFRICRSHYGALVAVMFVINLPALLLGMFAATAPFASFMQNMLFMVADGAIIAIVSEVYLGRPAEASTGLHAIRGRVGSLIGASILRNLVVLLGFLLLIVPGLYLMVATFAVSMVIVVEGHHAGSSFTRSRLLVEHNFWHAARTLLLLGAIIFALIIGLGALLGIATESMGLGDLLADTILNLALILLYPLFSVGGTLLYYDLRIRTEGFDVEMMLQDLAPAPCAVPGGPAPAPITWPRAGEPCRARAP